MTLSILLTIDVGPDGAALGKGHESAFHWETTRNGIELMLEALHTLSVRHGLDVTSTWFVRADDTIKKSFGSYPALFDIVTPTITSASSSFEVGWLPQLYTEDSSTHGISCVQSFDFCLSNLSQIYGSLAGAGYSVKSTRMGDCYHSNQSMMALDKIGIEYDCSALPGRIKKHGGWYLDWEPTDHMPYRPSKFDYRVAGKPDFDLIEIPLTMVDIFADYDKVALARYVNPCFKKELLWQSLGTVIAKSDFVHCVMHPDEIMPLGQYGHPLVSYDFTTTIDNVSGIVRACESSNRDVEFCTVQSFGKKWK